MLGTWDFSESTAVSIDFSTLHPSPKATKSEDGVLVGETVVRDENHSTEVTFVFVLDSVKVDCFPVV